MHMLKTLDLFCSNTKRFSASIASIKIERLRFININININIMIYINFKHYLVQSDLDSINWPGMKKNLTESNINMIKYMRNPIHVI